MTSGTFVGRSGELEQLAERLAAARDNSAVTVMLGGMAGVGKSRLLGEFVDTGRATGAHVLRGSCIELVGGSVLPYAPLIEALQLLVPERGEAVVRDLGGSAYEDLTKLITDFTPAEPAASPGSQLRVFRAVLRLLDRIGANAPEVLIFEDLHWADPSTLDLVSYLTRAKSHERLMLICSYRSDLKRRHPLRRLLSEPDFTRRTHRITLDAFDREELRQFLGPLEAGLVERCFDLSQGNAFFAEQLLASGALAGPTAKVPDSLSDVLLSRIDQLSEDAVDVLRIAACAGRKVSDRLLGAVSDLDGRTLEAVLHECVDEQMLVVDPEDETYVFRHALLREVVYQSLMVGERKRLHAAMAEALTADSGLSFAEDLTAAAELAYHWFAAGRRPEALAAAVCAGGAAVRMRAFREAETQYKRALLLWSQVKDPAAVAGMPSERIRAAAADAARWAGHVTQAVEFMLAATQEVDPVADPVRAGELYERLAGYQWEAGAITESVEAYHRAARLLAGRPPTAVTARVLSGRAMAALREGHYREALDHAEQAIAIARTVGARPEEGHALTTAGLALAMLGEPGKGVDFSRAGLRLAQESDDLEDLFRAYANLGVVLEHSGQPAQSVTILLEGLQQVRELGLGTSRLGGVLAGNAAAALFLLGRWDDATALLDGALQDRPAGESRYLRLTLAELDVARGRFDEAAALMDAVRTGSDRDPRFLGPLYGCAAELAIWRDDAAEAGAAAARGIAAVDGADTVLDLLRVVAVGLRAAADECARFAAGRAGERAGGRAAEARAEELVALARRTAQGHLSPPEIGALAQLCEAERVRAAGADTAGTWQPIATAWDGLDRPYPAAYARWRMAAAAVRAGDLAAAATAARAAHQAAVALDAGPLRTAIERLAGPAHLDLAVARPKPVKNRFGLTPQELTVLGQIVAGATNRQIAKNLFIAEKTVGVHVQNIFKKLDVHNRTAAALVAHQFNLVAE